MLIRSQIPELALRNSASSARVGVTVLNPCSRDGDGGEADAATAAGRPHALRLDERGHRLQWRCGGAGEAGSLASMAVGGAKAGQTELVNMLL